MTYQETDIPGVFIITPRVFEDARGYFMETWREEDFNRGTGQTVHFVQDNQSMSTRGVLRGLHYQKGADSQAKLVRAVWLMWLSTSGRIRLPSASMSW